MEPLEVNATAMVASVEGAVRQGSALVVQYSFSILGAIIVLVVGYMIAGLVERWAYAGLKRVRGFDETLRQFFSKILRYAVLLVVGVTVLAQFGVQTASILAAMGAIGLAIGLALQGTLQNIAAGIMLLVLRPFKAGEYIEAGDVKGTIREIGLFATELKTLEGLYVLAPNSELWKQPVTNFNRNEYRRHDLTIGIGYDDDIDLAERTMMDVAGNERRVKKEPAPVAFVSTLGDSTISVTLRYWTATADFLMTKFEMQKRAKVAFDDKGISMPFPQQEIRYVASESENAPPPAGPSAAPAKH